MPNNKLAFVLSALRGMDKNGTPLEGGEMKGAIAIIDDIQVELMEAAKK